MTLKDLLKKQQKIKDNATESSAAEFTFMRSDTNTQELIEPPSYPDDQTPRPHKDHRSISEHFSRFRSSSNASVDSTTSSRGEKRLSHRLHLRSHSRTSSSSSVNLPTDLPAISDDAGDREEREAQWENRATILAKENPIARQSLAGSDSDGRPPISRGISDAQDLERSTALFGRLAETNAMAQILYGLALRHGWGIPPNAPLAITYLSQAASNAAAVESAALSSGMKKGGAAKGELVLAIYELANSYRHGWGVEKDPVAARSYYETAANLGDTDAMNEVARCYEEGFGGKKDKFVAARYYRLAEEQGNKTFGNSWIWKDKYGPKSAP
ncbi:MAG: hypothetical protein LQ342_004877 [Letrouitia transgressa]|nr:MAG: hypothetical protein LQ342_004877 [Letrouitia transgressa]